MVDSLGKGGTQVRLECTCIMTHTVSEIHVEASRFAAAGYFASDSFVGCTLTTLSHGLCNSTNVNCVLESMQSPMPLVRLPSASSITLTSSLVPFVDRDEHPAPRHDALFPFAPSLPVPVTAARCNHRTWLYALSQFASRKSSTFIPYSVRNLMT